MSGRSTERLIEELLQTDPNRLVWYFLNPIEEYENIKNHSDLIDARSTAYTADLPYDSSLFNIIFPEHEYHLQIEKLRFFGNGERDWHVLDRSNGVAVTSMVCKLTGAELRLTLHPRELAPRIISSFDMSEMQERFHKSLGGEVRVSNQDLNASWTMFARILNDLITVEPTQRRGISANAPKPSVLLDLNLVLPFIGFHYNEETNKFDPPSSDNVDYIRWLRRVLLEVEVNISSRSVLPDLCYFLECETTYTITPSHMNAQYACLGAVSLMSDERLWDRYLLASQQDSGGIPWYLDAVSSIAQDRQSEYLQMQALSLVSLGIPTISSIKQQLESFNLDPAVAVQLSTEELAEIVLNSGRLSTNGGGELLLKNVQALKHHAYSENLPQNDTQNDILQRLISISESAPEQVSGMLGQDPEENFKRIWRHSASFCEKLEAIFILRAYAFAGETYPSMIALLEQSIPNQELPSVETSYAILGAQPEDGFINDNAIMAMFWAQSEEASRDRILELRAAVRVIAETRHSQELWQFLGYPDLSQSSSNTSMAGESSSKKLPPGLWNIGNTCYLNSLLQYYYSIPPLREYLEHEASQENAEFERKDGDQNTRSFSPPLDLIDIDEPEVVKVEEVKENKTSNDMHQEYDKAANPLDTPELKMNGVSGHAKSPVQAQENTPTIGGRKVSPNEYVRSKYFVYILGKLFQEIGSTKGSYVIPSDILAYMALIRPQEDADIYVERGPSYLRDQLGAALQRQQDVTECIENVLDQLEATMPAEGEDSDGEQLDLVKKLFYGTTSQVLQRVKDGGNRRTKTERFSSLLIDAGDRPGSLYNALDRAFADDILDLEEGTSRRTLQIKTLPRYLQIQVQRVQFDRVSFMPYKNLNPVIFDDTIYMDRYMASEEGSDLQELQERSKKLGEELTALKNEIESSRSDIIERKNAVDATLDWIRGSNEGCYTSDDTSTGTSDSTSEQFMDDGRPSEEISRHQTPKMSSSTNTSTNTSKVSSPNSSQASPDPSSPAKSLPAPSFHHPDGVFKPEVSEAIISSLQRCSEALAEQLKAQDLKQKELEKEIDEMFDEYKQYGYRLHALFIHKGDVSYGHYWIYIRNAESGNFLKYNDEYVSEATDEEVFSFITQPATPYFIVFEEI